MGRVPDDHNPPGEISTRLVSFAADSADPPRVNDYDGFARAYAASNENNLVNAYYERPAMLALAGDVAGRRILDAGCGTGHIEVDVSPGCEVSIEARNGWLNYMPFTSPSDHV